jgi:hypothetical protein
VAAPLRHFRLSPEPSAQGPQPLGLSCGPEGPALAGAPLLRKTDAGFAPRALPELAALTLAAYGEIPNLERLTRALTATADALNRADLPLAMTATVHLQLPDVTAGVRDGRQRWPTTSARAEGRRRGLRAEGSLRAPPSHVG